MIRLPLIVAAGAALLLTGWILLSDPRQDLTREPLPATVTIYDRHGAPLYEALDPRRGKARYVPLREMSDHLVWATVATEDATFYSNPGVDPGAILRALIQNWRSEEVVSGGSTLTQQLARNLWMSPEERAERNLGRKLREVLLALRLAVHLSKDEILEWYLNTAPYGHQAVGVEAAAQVYFGKRARDLDLAESALLAGLPQAPSAYDPFVDLERARARQRVVLSLMAKQGFVGDSEAETAAREPLALTPAAFPLRAPHFVAYVRQLLAEELAGGGYVPRDESSGMDGGGIGPALERLGSLRVHTTLDLGLQEVAEATVMRNVVALADKKVSNGALVALDPESGQILAMVGSADYFDRSAGGEVNVALAPRQPGSSIKPLLYAAALEGGVTAATILYDVPTAFLTADGKSYAPENYDRVWHGPVSVREALASSYNLPAVRLMQQVGVDRFLSLAVRAGLTTLASKGSGDLSLALGSGEVRLLDMASAFAAFAAGGVRREPVAILKVEDAAGRVVWDWNQASGTRQQAAEDKGTGRQGDGGSAPALTPTPSHQQAGQRKREQRVVSPQVAYLITSILSDNEARSGTFGAYSPLRLSRPAAAKTGTTTDWRDNWTVGYTPDLAVAVWVGNADSSPMEGVSGISGAAPIWRDFMEEALKSRPAREFPQPPGLVSREVCPESGEMPSPLCPNRRLELFLEGTEPRATCSWHRVLRVDSSTGQLAGPDTPAGQVAERVYLALPPELHRWALERGVLAEAGGQGPGDGGMGGHEDAENGDQAPDTSHQERMRQDSGLRTQDPALGARHPAPTPGPWPPPPRLVLTSPSHGAVLQISRDLPRALQRVEVAAASSGVGEEARVELRVDGSRLAVFDAPPYRTTWQVSPGQHRFEAVALAPDGSVLAAAEAQITVEDAPQW